MLIDIIEVTHVREYILHLRFEDGMEGDMDVSALIEFTGIFTQLKDPDFFSQVQLNKEWGTVYWSNGADIDPDVLYAAVSGQAIPSYPVDNPVPPGDVA